MLYKFSFHSFIHSFIKTLCVHVNNDCSRFVTLFSYKAELAQKESMLVDLQKDMNSLSAKYSDQKQQMEDDMRSKCAAAECKILPFRCS